ncbi:hypothetical protein GGI12_005419 [Dipsacomyces acuminosporus]|nr:hypothetical protein GGI12_005419 [Dipsacomyces acuminosporus]
MKVFSAIAVAALSSIALAAPLPQPGSAGANPNDFGAQVKRDGDYQAKPNYNPNPYTPGTNPPTTNPPTTNPPYTPPSPPQPPVPPVAKPCGSGTSSGLVGGVIDAAAPITCGVGTTVNNLLGFH